MSETSGVRNRSRRRAVRSEGPPPEEGEIASRALDSETPDTDPVVAAPAATGAGPAAEAAAVAAEPAATAVEPAAAPEPAAAAAIPDAEHTSDSTVRLDKAPAPADSADSEESEESEAPAVASAASGPTWMKIVAAVCVVLSLTALGATGFFLFERNSASDLEAQRTEYTQFAKQAMTTIVNINGESAPEDFAKALEVTSGDFAADLASRKDEFSQLIQKAQVKVKGEVVATALESSDDHAAIVLVAVKQVLTNAGVDGEQQRQYRFRVTIGKDDGGKLSVTGMEMVF